MAIGEVLGAPLDPVTTCFLSSTRPSVFLTGCHNSPLGYTLLPLLSRLGYAVHTAIPSSRERLSDKLYALGCFSVHVYELPLLTAATPDLSQCTHTLERCTTVVHIAAPYTRAFSTHLVELFHSLPPAPAGAPRKFITVSNCSVIPAPVRAETREAAQALLESTVDPVTSRLAHAEHCCQKVARDAPHRACYIILRPALLWGMHKDPFVANAVTAARNNSLRLVNSGRIHISTCHIFNACEAIVSSMKHAAPHLSGNVYAVTDGFQGQPLFRDFLAGVLRAANVEEQLVRNALNRSLSYGLVTFIVTVCNWLYSVFVDSSVDVSKFPLSYSSISRVGLEMYINDEQTRTDLRYQNAVSIQEGIQLLDFD